MIPYPYNMVDMGGIDLAEANGTVVEGLYARIVESVNVCGDIVLYNWKFAGIEIVPQHTQILLGVDSLTINTLIQVTEQDVVTVLGIEPPPPPVVPVSPLVVSENGTYSATPPASGFNPVTVNVESEGALAFIRVNYPEGSICTIEIEGVVSTAPDQSGTWLFMAQALGEATITARDGDLMDSDTVSISLGDSVAVTLKYRVGPGYTEIPYLEVGSSPGPFIDTGVVQEVNSYFDLDMQYTTRPNSNMWAFGTNASGNNEIGYYGIQIYFWVNSGGYTGNFDTNRHVYSYRATGAYIDDVQINTRVGGRNNQNYYIFSRGNDPTNNCRVYHCVIYSGDEVVRDFYPCYRNSDNELGLFDSVNQQFYPNNGTGQFSQPN